MVDEEEEEEEEWKVSAVWWQNQPQLVGRVAYDNSRSSALEMRLHQHRHRCKRGPRGSGI